MESNFYFLKDRFQEYYDLACEAEKHVRTNPRTSAIYARLTLEELIKWMYKLDNTLSHIDRDNFSLNDMMHQNEFKQLLSGTPN